MRKATAWQIASWAMVKSTGFPYEMLERLGDDRMGKLVEGPDEVGLGDAIADNVRALARACGDPLFLEAVFLSSEEAFERLHAWSQAPPAGRLNTRERRQALLAARYLQRLCAKNESTSFFGPVGWVRVGVGDRLAVDTAGGLPARAVCWSHWAVRALADVISADPAVAPQIVPRRPPWLFAGDAGTRAVRFVDHPTAVDTLVLPPEGSAEGRLLALCDGTRTAAECADQLGLAPEMVVDLLRRLRARDLVEFAIEPAMGLADPMADLRREVERFTGPARDRWLAVLDQLDQHRSDFHAARGLDARVATMRAAKACFTAHSGIAADRAAGEHAADRTVLIEDCRHDWPTFDIGGAAHDYLRDELPVILDLLFELPLARRRARVAHLQSWFRQRFGTRRDIPLDEALVAAAESDHALGWQLRAIDNDIRRTGPSAISDVLFRDPNLHRVRLPRRWAEDRAGERSFDTWCVCGADIFLRAPSVEAIDAGAFEVVIGEVHGLHDQLLQGLWPQLHPDPASLGAEIADLVRRTSDLVICDPTLPHRRKTMARLPALPEVAFVGRSPRRRHRQTEAHALRVRWQDDHLVLHGEPLGRIGLTRPPLWWWDDEVESIFSAFTGARLVAIGDAIREESNVDHLPRLTVGRTVVRRETWWLPPLERSKWSSLTPGNQVVAWQAKERLGLPAQVYVKFAEEPKPLFIDFQVPVLVDGFVRAWQRAKVRSTVSEMLPGPDELWLRDRRGRYTCELRLGCYRHIDQCDGEQRRVR